MINRFIQICVRIIPIITFVLVAPPLSVAQHTLFPRYADVAQHFFMVSSCELYKGKELTFEKKPQGWFAHVTASDRQNDSTDTLLYVWNAASASWTDTQHVICTTPDSSYQKDVIDYFEKIHFDVCPYYGYREWYLEVLRDYSDYDGDSVEMIYGIGRAYSMKATNLLSDQSGTADSAMMFDLKSVKEKLSVEQLQEYRLYRHKAIEFYSRAEKLNPDFQTMVGSIGLKKEMEYVTCYFDLLQFSTPEEALKELPKNLFSPFYRDYAYNMLMSCPKNGILFTNGDTDTFLPMYMQATENLRKDVTMVNVGMLQLPRYCEFLNRLCHVKFSCSTYNNEHTGLTWIFLEEDTLFRTWNAADVFDYCNDPSNFYVHEGYSYTKLPTNHFTIRRSEVNIEWSANLTFIYRHQLLLADIIYSNISDRPIYFATTNSTDNFTGLENNLATNLMTYKLVNENVIVGKYIENVQSDVAYQQAMEVFKWDHASAAVAQEKMLCVNYRINLCHLADQLADENKSTEAQRIIDLVLQHFGNDHVPFDYFTLPLLKACYKIGNLETGNIIAKQLAFNCAHKIESLDSTLIRKRNPFYTGLTDDVKEIMVRFNQDVGILREE